MSRRANLIIRLRPHPASRDDERVSVPAGLLRSAEREIERLRKRNAKLEAVVRVLSDTRDGKP